MNGSLSLGDGPWVVIKKRRVLNLAGGDILGLRYDKDFMNFLYQNLKGENISFKVPFQLVDPDQLWLPPEFPNSMGFEAGIAGRSTEGLMTSVLEILQNDSPVLADEHLDPALRGILLLSPRTLLFPHNSPAKLEEIITKKELKKPVIITQTLFPYSSEFSPLKDLSEICKRHEGTLIIYESWADGVIDFKQIASLNPKSISHKILVIGDFSHILPFSCSYLLSERSFLENFVQNSSCLRSLPQPSSFHLKTLLWFLEKMRKGEKGLLQRLNDNANYLRYELLSRGLKVSGDFTPYIPVIVGNKRIAQNFKASLIENGVLASEVSYPLVPIDKSRILLIPSVLHTKDDLDFAIQKIIEVAKFLNLI
ncbi:MAG: aminotransferase class I/II-fold pyridoxal phosphate-dependent enzyme [Candidatus Hydrothermia bacterium]